MTLWARSVRVDGGDMALAEAGAGRPIVHRDRCWSARPASHRQLPWGELEGPADFADALAAVLPDG
jgi:hypothetical protein